MTTSLGFGFKIGHWTDGDARTGCTVVLPPPGNVTSCDIRGSSPSTRELAHLDPDRRLTEVHGILLTGGSAFGLAAAEGVVDWLAERGIGYQTPIAAVPIVPAAVILDLGHGDPSVRPGREQGRAACEAASEGSPEGRVGAGAGATVGKWAGFEHRAPGGLGIATVTKENVSVSALAVVNAVGDIVDDNGTVIAGSTAEDPVFMPHHRASPVPGNTVLAVVACSGQMDKRDVRWIAGRGSDGIARSVRPAHTRFDGDVVFACAAPSTAAMQPVEIDLIGYLATEAVATAVRRAVRA
jgi:L-aminopeptidase/D-esterase-like protein